MVSAFLLYLLPPTILVLIGIRKYCESKWTTCRNQIKLNNKVAIVTGANSGIGFEIAKELAGRNAEVILACRNLDLARRAIEKIRNQLTNKTKLVAMELDLASLMSVKNFASKIQEEYPTINLLINNAGVSYPSHGKSMTVQTQDGNEIHFGVNHLGHYYLTKLLLNTLIKSQPSRVVIISSTLHEKGLINVDNLNNDQPFDIKAKLYANSKLANIYYCRELSEQTKDTGVNIYAVCPGWVYTSLFRHSIKWYHYLVGAPIAFFFMRSPKQGSETAIYCATEPELENESGLIYRDCEHYTSRINFNPDLGRRLLEESDKLINKAIKQSD